MKTILSVVEFFFAITITQANALEVAVADVRVKLAGPKGYCPLDKRQPADSQLLAINQQALQGRNEQLALFVSCDRLKAWRDGKTDDLGAMADYQISLRMKGQQASADKTLPDLCAEMRKQGAAIVKGVTRDMNKRYDSVSTFGEAKG